MSEKSTIDTYLDVLSGQTWPKGYLSDTNVRKKLKEILLYLLEEEQITDAAGAKELFSQQYLKEKKLSSLLKKYPKPPELLPDENDHLVWLLFPETKISEYGLIIKVTDDVISGRRKLFPSKYFTQNSNATDRAVIAFVHLCEDVLKLSDEEIIKTFGKSYGINTLKKYNLTILAKAAFPSMKELFKESYPDLYEKKEES